MRKSVIGRMVVLILICALFPAILLSSVICAKAQENILFKSSFDQDVGIIFLKGKWTLSLGELIPKSNDENRLVFAGTDSSDYIITSNATFLSGGTGQSGYGIYFRATNSPDISGYCFQYDNGVGKRFIVRKVTDGKEGVAQHMVPMSTVMGSDFDITAPHTVTITAIGSNFTIKVDQKEVIKFTDTTYTKGYVGLRSWAVSNNLFHDIVVTGATASPWPTPAATSSPATAPMITPIPIPNNESVTLDFSYAYLYGYESGGVGADDTIKREEAAALIYRLLKQNDKLGEFTKPSQASFADVAEKRWSFSAMEYMASIDVFQKSNRYVKPDAIITRGEASKIITYSMGLQPDDKKENTFSDLGVDNVYYSAVKALVDAGLLRGYQDGTIRPSGNLTRAEYVTMINRLIGRDNSKYDISDVNNIYPDLANGHWAYENIIRASFGFGEEDGGKYKIDPKKKLKRSEIDYN